MKKNFALSLSNRRRNNFLNTFKKDTHRNEVPNRLHYSNDEFSSSLTRTRKEKLGEEARVERADVKKKKTISM